MLNWTLSSIVPLWLYAHPWSRSSSCVVSKIYRSKPSVSIQSTTAVCLSLLLDCECVCDHTMWSMILIQRSSFTLDLFLLFRGASILICLYIHLLIYDYFSGFILAQIANGSEVLFFVNAAGVMHDFNDWKHKLTFCVSFFCTSCLCHCPS